MTDTELLDIFAKHPRWELGIDYEASMDGDTSWCVWDVRGSVNDREWFLIGRRNSPRNALLSAMKGLK